MRNGLKNHSAFGQACKVSNESRDRQFSDLFRGDFFATLTTHIWPSSLPSFDNFANTAHTI